MVFQGFLAFIFVLSVLVFVHEFGHFIVAKWCGVKIDSFSIGMGKELFGWNDKSGTRWKISMLPFGGYVKMFGDEDEASAKVDKKKLEKLSDEEKKYVFFYQNVYKKLAIIAAGPIFNLIFAILLMTSMLRITGTAITTSTIGDVLENSPAEIAGLKAGDEVIKINDINIKNFSEISNFIAVNNTKTFSMTVLRDEKPITIEVTPTITDAKDMFGNSVKTSSIGILSKEAEVKKLNLAQSLVEAVKNVYVMCKNTLVVLGQIITGSRGTEGLGGPLKIAQYSAQSFHGGLLMVVYFMALISANLGLMNLLPIPVLDGGHIFFYILEIVFRRPIPEKLQTILLNIGFYFLIGLMIFATLNDVRGFVK